MRLKLIPASPDDAESIAALRNAVSDDLTFRHGKGPWTLHWTTAGVLFDLRNAKLFVATHRDDIVASLCLTAKKPWAIDRAFFTAVKRPLYLTSMAVAPELQRQGIGRQCMMEVAKLARRFKADAVFFDAFDHPAAGTGSFYAKCGCREVGRATYRAVPLVYYELLLRET